MRPSLTPEWTDGTTGEWTTGTPDIHTGSVRQWFAKKFPLLPSEFGDAVLEEYDKHKRLIVCDLCQPFLAATLGELGMPAAPTVFVPAENRFWAYSPDEGVFIEIRDAAFALRN